MNIEVDTVITQKEFDALYKKHRLWIKNEEDGSRMELAHDDLTHIDMSGYNLSKAIIRRSNLEGVNMDNCCAEKAVFYGSNMINVSLKGADMWSADLRYCDMTGCVTDEKTIMGDTNLLGAKGLPRHISLTCIKKAMSDESETLYNDGLVIYWLDSQIIELGTKKYSLDSFKEHIEGLYGDDSQELNAFIALYTFARSLSDASLKEHDQIVVCEHNLNDRKKHQKWSDQI